MTYSIIEKDLNIDQLDKPLKVLPFDSPYSVVGSYHNIALFYVKDFKNNASIDKSSIG